jgi:hypothetical protein
MTGSLLKMFLDSRQLTRWLACSLALLITFPPEAAAQSAAPPAQPQPATIRNLKVIPLAGNQEMNDVKDRVMAPLVIQVLDQNDHPVEGADVTFRFPLSGPSATFADEKNAGTFRTNVDGQAAAVGWMANGHLGTFNIQVTAVRGAEEGSAVVSMTNVSRITEAGSTKRKSWWSNKWVKIAIIAGAAAIVVGVVLATRGSGSSGGKVITATPGAPTIGGPQ